MKRMIKAAKAGVKLKVTFEPYTRFGSNGVKTATVSGVDLLDALKKMCDRMQLYIDSNDIEDDDMSAEDVIGSLKGSNGDGCDYILSLTNLTTGDNYISENYKYEEWD